MATATVPSPIPPPMVPPGAVAPVAPGLSSAAQARQPAPHHLPRLNIPPLAAVQQHFAQSMFSPAIPSAIPNAGFRPAHGIHAQSIHTPLQSSFFPRPPGAPGRPQAYHKGHPSMAGFNIMPPNSVPMTPLGQAFPQTPMLLGPGVNSFAQQQQQGGGGPPHHQHHGRNRRQPSVSVGGPPKAVLGGPNRKPSPLPPTPAAAATAPEPAAPAPAPIKTKKVVVKIPKERTEDGPEEWAREPIHEKDLPEVVQPPPLELTTREPYPSDYDRLVLPPTLDVFLPGKSSWDEMRQRTIEEKLEKLGIGRASGSDVPHIFAPHARSASVSSPADPALLLFKLNKLQLAQSQTSSAAHSLSASPIPPHAASPAQGASSSEQSSDGSGSHPLARLQARHGHSMSLAQPPTFRPLSTSFNPFGPDAIMGEDEGGLLRPRSTGNTTDHLNNNGSNSTMPDVLISQAPNGIAAPQGRVPLNFSSLAPPNISRPTSRDSRPDFARGFGLDIPEEEEPEEEQQAIVHGDADDEDEYEHDKENKFVGHDDDDAQSLRSTEDTAAADQEQDEVGSLDRITATNSRAHSRHVSKLSAALSLRSVGGVTGEALMASGNVLSPPEQEDQVVDDATQAGVEDTDIDVELDAVDDWTGSDDESIGEWSNPSDEERARQQRAARRRNKHHQHQSRQSSEIEVPRRLPKFPRPPDNTSVFGRLDHAPPNAVFSRPQLPPASAFDNNTVAFGRPSLGDSNTTLAFVVQAHADRMGMSRIEDDDDDDDIVSNPSEEGRNDSHHHHHHHEYLGMVDNNNNGSSNRYYDYAASPNGRPLPPLPHSRVASGTFTHSRGPSGHMTAYDPGLAHSRQNSMANSNSGLTPPGPIATPSFTTTATTAPRKDALNPFAKPFVFGGAPRSVEPVVVVPTVPAVAPAPAPAPILAPVSVLAAAAVPAAAASHDEPAHTRTPSFGKPLNVAAPEFKPSGGFTFRPPPTAPQLSFGTNGSDGEHASLGAPAELGRPLPLPPVGPSPARVQGREKRQRRAHNTDSESEAEGHDGDIDTMHSFRFPVPVSTTSPQRLRRASFDSGRHSPVSDRHSASSSPAVMRQGANGFASLAGAGMPFTFSGFPSSLSLEPATGAATSSGANSVIVEPGLTMRVDIEDDEEGQVLVMQEGQDGIIDSPETDENMLPPPSLTRAKRAPIPLDFKHPHPPVSKNTVPAGLFKALVNGAAADERTRRAVRSRLDSRELFDHVRRPSLDDMVVPSISHKSSRNQLVPRPPVDGTAAGAGPAVDDEELEKRLDAPLEDKENLFSGSNRPSSALPPHISRRSSYPTALHSAANSSLSGVSIPAVNLTRTLEVQRLEDRLEVLLEEKLAALRYELRRSREATENRSMSAHAEEMIAEVVSLFRAQLTESAARSLEESQMDARGELDFQLLSDIVQRAHEESRQTLKDEVAWLAQRLEAVSRERDAQQANASSVLVPTVQDLHNRTMAIVNNIAGRVESALAVQQQQLKQQPQPSFDKDGLLRDLSAILMPTLESLRPTPVDYDALTNQLTQAVKPHISQLIDLASDKRETAGLIVERIIPLLPSTARSSETTQEKSLDTDALVGRLSTEIRKLIAPIDPFEIKEQVADLVVERLDSRLAVRDRVALTAEVLSGKLEESSQQILTPIGDLAKEISGLVAAQQELGQKSDGLVSSIQKDVTALLSDLPQNLVKATEALQSTEAGLRARTEEQEAGAASAVATAKNIESAVLSLVDDQKALSQKSLDLLSSHNDTVQKLDTIQSAVATVTDLVQTLQAASGSTSKQDADELRKLRAINTEVQVELAKARGAHGQVRVEKDNYKEKLKVADAEREKLRAQVEETNATLQTKDAAIVAAEAKNAQLEAALAQALEKLKDSEEAAQATREKVVALEKSEREANTEKYTLNAKISSLELQLTLATREKETATQSLEAVQKDRDDLASQAKHWDDEFRQTAEKIDLLTTLVKSVDNDELTHLRKIRDRNVMLENEHAALQKRYKEQDAKVANSERTAFTARQSLAQAQQRSSEWEKKFRESEGKLELVQTKFDQSEQTLVQLDSDHTILKLQFEELEADGRLVKDRELKLVERVAALEQQLSNARAEAERIKRSTVAPQPAYHLSSQIGQNIHRPDSRASTVYQAHGSRPDSRASTMYNHQGSLRNGTPPTTSVRDSMHAPRYPVPQHVGLSTPKARHALALRAAAPSPTPSNVSAAPTQGDDGWWH